MLQTPMHAAADENALRLVTGLAPLTAFARAVGHLMTRPAFANAPFGHIARALAGQVNRGHYAFVHRARRSSASSAGRWSRNPLPRPGSRARAASPSAEARGGRLHPPELLAGRQPRRHRALIEFLAAKFPDKRRLYAKRHYPDGRIRPLRLDLAPRA